jgi:hypothetical protein
VGDSQAQIDPVSRQVDWLLLGIPDLFLYVPSHGAAHRIPSQISPGFYGVSPFLISEKVEIHLPQLCGMQLEKIRFLNVSLGLFTRITLLSPAA